LFDFIPDRPENVRFTTNTTSEVCTGVVINFTYAAELLTRPAVHTFLLYENDTLIENMGISGTWIKALWKMLASLCSDVRLIIISQGLKQVMIPS